MLGSRSSPIGSPAAASPTLGAATNSSTTTSTAATTTAPLEDPVARWVLLVGFALFCGIILLVVLLPLSYVYLEYYELGLVRSRTRGVVDTSKVYGPGGRWLMQPDATFQKYQADAHVYNTDKTQPLSVVTKDRLQVLLQVVCVYFITRDKLPNLQQEFNLNYHSMVDSNAISGIKNTAVNFTTREYFARRTAVQSSMHMALQDMETKLYVTFPYFYITGMQISDTVAAKQLQTSVQNEINAKQLFDNTAAEVRAQTDTTVNELHNNATQFNQTAIAQANAAVAIAKSQAKRIVDEARTLAAASVFKKLGLTTQGQKQDIDRMFWALRRKDVTLRLGYQPQLVQATGPVMATAPASG